MVRDVSKYLATKEAAASADTEVAKEWSKLDELYTKRLWHQLTMELLTFINSPALKGQLLDLYDNFISDIEMRINPLNFSEMITSISKEIPDSREALAFVEKAEPKVKADNEAVAHLKIIKGQISLQLEDIEAVKNLLDEADEILKNMYTVSAVHGKFYHLQSELYKKLGETTLYYKSALKFLGCVELKTISTQDQFDHAKHLAIAALIGEDIYNFGELLGHPIIGPLTHSRDQWLVNLLKAFNEGDLANFEELKKFWSREPLLAKNEEALRTKITLLCLMEMTFKKSATNRQFTFGQISQEAKLNHNEVELMVMRAISRGLIQGHIDEVAKKVSITWVQPRVLDRVQIGGMVSRLDTWKKEIDTLEKMVESNASEILLA